MGLLNKRFLHITGLVISLVFVYLVFRNTNLLEIFQIISGLKIINVVVVAILSLSLVVFKTFRWKLILNKSEHIPYKKLLTINFTAHMFNILLPFRAGEIIQIFLTKNHTKTGRSNIAASIVLNKFLELLSILIIFYLLIAIVDISIPSFWLVPIKYLLVFSILFLMLFAFKVINVEKIRTPGNRILQSIHSFLSSLNHLSDKVLLAKTLLLSLFIWGIEILMIYILITAFNITAPIWAPVVVLVGINLAMLVPATSASFGTYEYSIILVLGLFAVTKDVSVAFAITLHFLEISLVLLAGLISYLKIKPALVIPLIATIFISSSVSANTVTIEDFKDNVVAAAPKGWIPGNNKNGKIDYYIVKEKERTFLRGEYLPDTTAKIIYLKRQFSLADHPYLTWKWRARKFPKLDSINGSEEPDNVATIYVMFKKRLTKYFIKYDWSQFNCKNNENNEPFAFKSNSSTAFGIIMIKPLRCTTAKDRACCKDKPGVWITEKVNLVEDFKRLFRTEWAPENLEGIGVLVDGDDTKTEGVSADFSDFMLTDVPKD